MRAKRFADPVAVIGLAFLLPGAADLETLAEVLAGRRSGGRRIERPAIRLEDYGIPPIYRRSIPDIHLLFVHRIEAALADAGLEAGDLPRLSTDVIVGTCFAPGRLFPNTLRIEAVRAVEEVRLRVAAGNSIDPARLAELSTRLARDVDRSLGGGFNDKLYENAGTLPAQISVFLGLRGRCLALESADLTSFVALETARTNLAAGDCDLALVACGQLVEGRLPEAALAARGLLADRPSPPWAAGGSGFELGEAIVAVVLERLSDARARGRRVRGVLSGIGLSREPMNGPLRYGPGVETRRAAIEAALAEAGIEPGDVDAIECFGSGFADESAVEAEALGRAFEGVGPVRVGCAKERFGHPIAASGLVSLATVLAALEAETLFGQPFGGGPTIDLTGLPLEPGRSDRPWPDTGAARRVLVAGSGLGGAHAALVVESAPSATVPSLGRRRPGADADASGAIAVVGIGARFGRHADRRAFAEAILAGQDSFERVEEVVLPRAQYFDPVNYDPLKSYTDLAAPVGRPTIEPARFRIVPRRLAAMDPAQRLALVAADEALAEAGPGRGTAVVLGSSLSLGAERAAGVRLDIGPLLERIAASELLSGLEPARATAVLDGLRRSLEDRFDPIGPASLDGYLASGIALHVANALGLDGPAWIVQAACASSIAAVDTACRGLRLGRWDRVLTGGIELGVNLHDLVLCSRMRLLSPTRITPFDRAADGFTMGEGAGFLVLRRLEDARADGQEVLAVIRSIGASCDARSLIAPQTDGQALAIGRAFESVDFSPDDVDLVEAHGTGTEVGDRVEAAAIRAVYGTGTRRRPLHVGSVKSMIGHAMAAAGSAGLIRAIAALEAATIPPSVGSNELAAGLDLDRIPATIPPVRVPWSRPNGPRRAGVSSFGTGGLNYHVLLEERS